MSKMQNNLDTLMLLEIVDTVAGIKRKKFYLKQLNEIEILAENELERMGVQKPKSKEPLFGKKKKVKK